jgi:hypothetical protein
MEIETGCQSLTIKNYQTQNVYGFHTEEDSTAYEHFGDACKGKYWVNFKMTELTSDSWVMPVFVVRVIPLLTSTRLHIHFKHCRCAGIDSEGLFGATWSISYMDCADISQINN